MQLETTELKGMGGSEKLSATKGTSTMLKSLFLVGALGAAAAGGYMLSAYYVPGNKPATTNPAASGGAGPATPTATTVPWVSAAPGRVEPKAGEVRIGAGILGRVTGVLIDVNDKVEEGELLIRLDDDEARARLAAAEAEAGGRRQERDAASATSGREDIRKTEDAVYSSERAETGARFDLDAALTARRNGTGSEQALIDARKRYTDARARLQRDRVAFAVAQGKANLPAPNRAESALSAARAQVAAAEALLDKSRIRAPKAGNVLQLFAKPGEMVAPSPEQPLLVMGDMSVLRVKAEVDEADASKIKVDQKAFVKSAGYPGREFTGKVVALAPTLAPPRIGLRGPRRPTDVEVLEVTIDLDGTPPLLPGMRVDAFFKKE